MSRNKNDVPRGASELPAELGAVVLKNDSPFVLKEAYKTLRTNVVFALPGEGAKVIGVTSGAAGEGKTTTALNLAISFGQVGERVLLLEADLRLPSLGKKLNISSRPGLSDLLTGASSSQEAIRQLDCAIDILTAGSLPRDPSPLLASKRMEALFEQLRGYYSHIIVDMPPVGTVSDAAVLAPLMDGYILVVRHNHSEYKDLARALRQMEFVGANILGVTYNDADIHSRKGYGYRKYGYRKYGYGYGYGYGK